MMSVTNTNIRVGPGVYLALKHMSDTSGLSIGAIANFFVITSLATNWKQIIGKLPPEIQTALVSDFMLALGDLFKKIGLDYVNETSVADLYQRLLNPEKNPLVS